MIKNHRNFFIVVAILVCVGIVIGAGLYHRSHQLASETAAIQVANNHSTHKKMSEHLHSKSPVAATGGASSSPQTSVTISGNCTKTVTTKTTKTANNGTSTVSNTSVQCNQSGQNSNSNVSVNNNSSQTSTTGSSTSSGSATNNNSDNSNIVISN